MKFLSFIATGRLSLFVLAVLSDVSDDSIGVSAFRVGTNPFSLGSPKAANKESTTSLFVSLVNVAENAPRDLESMDQWAAGCGVQRADGFQLTMSPDGSDCSVVTNQNLAANQPVLFVPSSMILTGAKAIDELGSVEASENLLEQCQATDQIPQFYLFLKVLKEYEMGEQSPWYPWLNSLPRYFSSGVSMTNFCTDCLPPLAGWLASNEQVRFGHFVEALSYVGCLNSETIDNKALAKWAYTVVYTRSFPNEFGDVQIAPMADMFNHGTQTEIQISSDAEGNCYAYSTYDIPAGSPLRMSYGDPTNPSFLFARYGFLDESSPATFCKIMINRPNKELVDLGYDHSRMLFYKDTGEVSQEVWDVLLYLHLGQSNPNDQRTFYEAHMRGDFETKQAVHAHYRTETANALRTHIDAFLRDLEVLSQKVANGNLNTHPRLPLLLKHNEFVKSTFLKVKEANLMQYA